MTTSQGNLTRQQFIAGAGAWGLAGCAEAPRQRPNVLVVIGDEWRAQAFGYAGDPNAKSAAIDSFAANALNFTQAISGTPVCSPSRAALMTGQYALTHGVYMNDVPLRPTGATLGEAFAQAGYQTGYIGKWHLHGSPEGNFERRRTYIPPSDRLGFAYWKAAECDHNHRRSGYYTDDDPNVQYWRTFDAIAQTQDACAFIRENVAKQDSYFLVLSWGPPHTPYVAPDNYAQAWANKPLRLRRNVPQRSIDAAKEELRGYYAQAEVLDDCFTQVLDAVRQSGTEDNTIVVFMADHGTMAYSQGLFGKQVPWEESIRIPLLIRYPRRYGARGRVVDIPINMPDVLPTLLSMADLEIPSASEGYDWTPHLDGRTDASAPTSAFLQVPVSDTFLRYAGIAEYRGVRTSKHTYVRATTGPWLLYDNEADPFQLNNLIGDNPELEAALEAELQRHLAARGDQFLPGSTYLRRAGLDHYAIVSFPIRRTTGFRGQWQSTLIEGAPGVIPSDPTAPSRLPRHTFD